MNRLAEMQRRTEGFFPGTLGVRFTTESDDRVEAELLVRDELCTTPGVMHGGALMGFADTLGGYAAYLGLPKGAATTTVESKTNFFAAARAGTTIKGVCECLHRGRRTMVWQTRIIDDKERLICLVTQTQIVLEAEPTPQDLLTKMFNDRPRVDQMTLLATLERAGAGLYRAFASDEADGARRAALLEAAAREESNADVLQAQVESAVDEDH